MGWFYASGRDREKNLGDKQFLLLVHLAIVIDQEKPFQIRLFRVFIARHQPSCLASPADAQR